MKPFTVVGLHADLTGCGTYRITNPLTTLKRAYQEVEVYFDVATKADVIVCQRTHSPSMIAHLRQIIETRGDRGLPRLVMELDDDLWSIPSGNGAESFYGPEVQANLDVVLGLVDGCITSTEALARVVRSHAPVGLPIWVAPNLIPDRLVRRSELNPAVSNRSSRVRGSDSLTLTSDLRIGYGGSPTHTRDFIECLPGLNRFLLANPASTLNFVGGDYRHLFPRVLEPQVRYLGYTKTTADYYTRIASSDFDVMIAPLEDNLFNQSKSNLKIIESSALGIPWVASDIGPYQGEGFPIHEVGCSATTIGHRNIPSGGLTTKNTTSDWVDALTEMSSPLRRAELRSEGLSWVQENYMLSRAPEMYLEIFTQLLNSVPPLTERKNQTP